MRSFDPLEIPMSGLKLIEASAGTGKTYSIALIFLRLLLERKLEIDQILVVTFTTAATEELRTRIRSRLCDAINHFENTVSAPNQDETLDEFLSALENRQEARTRLADALARMDEAAIYTIHGFGKDTKSMHGYHPNAEGNDGLFVSNKQISKLKATLPDVFVSTVQSLGIDYKPKIKLDGENILS